jgi:hypothetical protein
MFTQRLRSILVLAGLVSTAPALAWDGQVTGQIHGADVTDGPNYAFRIDLQGSPTLCGSSATWAYVDSNTPNYGAYVATILAAKATGDTVVVYTNRDAGTGYCRIGYVRTIAG